EIGCGSAVILKKLKTLGFKDLTGIEPGNHTLTDGLDDVKIVRDFFPSDKISAGFDLIFSFCVLEHIEEPSFFLKNCASQLKTTGKLIIGVPNCEPFLNTGDISIFLHEHF